MFEVSEAYKHLNENERKELQEYAKIVRGYTNSLNASLEKSKEVYETLTEYNVNRFAALHYMNIYNSLADKMNALYKLYEQEPNERKAYKHLQEYNRLKVDLQKALNKYNYFEGKRSALEKGAIEADNFIDRNLVRGVEKQWEKREETQKKFKKKK